MHEPHSIMVEHLSCSVRTLEAVWRICRIEICDIIDRYYIWIFFQLFSPSSESSSYDKRFV